MIFYWYGLDDFSFVACKFMQIKSSASTHLFSLAYELLCITCGRYRFQTVINVEIFPQEPGSKPISGSWLSAVFFSAKLQQPGDEPAPKRWTVILYLRSSLFKSPSSHHKKRNGSLQCSMTWTCRNITSISAMKATGSLLNLASTPTSLLVRSGPWRRCLLRAFDLLLMLTCYVWNISPWNEKRYRGLGINTCPLA